MKSYGRTELRLEAGATVRETKEGLSTGRASWTCPAERAYNLAPRVGSRHPHVGFLLMEEREIVFGAGLATITGQFAGMEPGRGDESEPVYELQIGANEEPLVLHPDFVEKMGGRPSKPLNGAIFLNPGTGDITTDDRIGAFDKFSLIFEDKKNPAAGIEAYLEASEVIWRAKYTSRRRPSNVGGVCTIDNPDGAPPSFGEGRTWLYLGLGYEQRGGVFSVVKEWKLSARGGWLPSIYGK